MKSILGFGSDAMTSSRDMDTVPSNDPNFIRSLVSVSFIDDGRVLTYYNDRFALQPGDRVFVSGKLAGKVGIVEKVTTKFKINLADYQRVIARAGGPVHGTYEAVLDKMVSFGSDAMTPDEFRAWIMPPAHCDDDEDDTGDQFIVGDGYELSIHDIENSEDVSREILDRAVEYCRSGKVAYINVTDGIGTAFIDGTSWYEVNFRLSGETITELYCDCPYPGLCKHILAVALTVRVLADFGKIDLSRDFTALEADRFWDMVAHSAKKITL